MRTQEQIERRREASRKYYYANKDKWTQYRQNTTRSSDAEYKALWRLRRLEQKSSRPCPELCEICGSGPIKKYGTRARLEWDHNHTTGSFRGWLCQLCNMALGCVNDDVSRLQALINYLQKDTV